MRRRVVLSVIAIALTAVVGCATDSTAPSGSNGSLTASVVAPRPTAPATGAQIKNGDQPGVARRPERDQHRDRHHLHIRGQQRRLVRDESADQGRCRRGQRRSDQRQTRLARGREGLLLARARHQRWHGRRLRTDLQIHRGSGDHHRRADSHFSAHRTHRPDRVRRCVSPTSRGPARRARSAYRFEISTSSSFSTVALTGIVNEGVNETAFILVQRSDQRHVVLLARLRARHRQRDFAACRARRKASRPPTRSGRARCRPEPRAMHGWARDGLLRRSWHSTGTSSTAHRSTNSACSTCSTKDSIRRAPSTG